MKLPLIVGVLFVLSISASAQSEQQAIKALLPDAAYVLNRFEETTTGLDYDIENFNVRESVKKDFKFELSVTLRNASAEKHRLNDLLTKDGVSAAELFDVYDSMVEVSSELFGQSSNFAQFGNEAGEAKAVELAQLGSKTWKLSGQFRDLLRSKLLAQEDQLEQCRTASSTGKHK